MKLLPLIVGITGRAGSGKDTLADLLVNHHGYRKVSLASPLKDMLNARFGWTDAQWQDREWKERPALCGIDPRSAELDGVTLRAWNRKEPYLSPREMAQWLGTEVGRVLAGPDVWVNLLLRQWNGRDRLVIADIRFDNEATILGRHGFIVHLDRPGINAVAAHVSEAGVDPTLLHAWITNDASHGELLGRFEAAWDSHLNFTPDEE